MRVLLAVLWLLIGGARGEECVPPGGVAGVVVATVVVTCVVGGLGAALAWRRFVRPRATDGDRQQHQRSDYAFDNPYFRDPVAPDSDATDKGKTRSSIIHKNSIRSSKSEGGASKPKKTKSGRNHFFGGGKKQQRTLDDSCLDVQQECERRVVSLRGVDFSGLGFNICGNMRDGILVKDVLHRGPASESGLIRAGDRILNVTVSFSNMVYEDALTILSYASPYQVKLEVERQTAARGRLPSSSSFSGQRLFHPLYRSQSIDDLTQIDRDPLGPRRSVGPVTHKLTRDSLLATGSLNEKMLANVMSNDWEKRFEDTLDSSGPEDSPQAHAEGDDNSASQKESEGQQGFGGPKTKRSYRQKKSKPPSGGAEDRTAKKENHRSEDEQRARTIAHSVSDSAVFLDQSNRDDLSRFDKSLMSTTKTDSSGHKSSTKPPNASYREDENDSDVSRDSLEQSKRNAPRIKKNALAKAKDVEGNCGGSHQHKTDEQRQAKVPTDQSNTERVYANNIISRSQLNHLNAQDKHGADVKPTAKVSYADAKSSASDPRSDGKTHYPDTRSNAKMSCVNTSQASYVDAKSEVKVTHSGTKSDASNTKLNTKACFPDLRTDTHRDTVEVLVDRREVRESLNRNSPTVVPMSYVERQQLANINYNTNNNGTVGDYSNKFAPNRAMSPVCVQETTQRFAKKGAANPAGMFTQINPFQIQSKQKKSWHLREDSQQQNGYEFAVQPSQFPARRPSDPPPLHDAGRSSTVIYNPKSNYKPH